MKEYISKSALVAEIEKRLNYRNKELDAINNGTFWDEEQSEDTFNVALTKCAYNAVKNELFELRCFLDIVETIEVKEVDLTDRKVDWSPSKKQMESLKDMLRYNIGVFDYQKFMEVNSLYDDLTKTLDYEIDRQK